MMKHARGFTLVELMITLTVAAVLLTLAAPSLYDFLLVQRLKSINAQLVTDMQFARSEALSRLERRAGSTTQVVDVQVDFRPAAQGSAMSCYSIYTDRSANPVNKCDCTQPAGQRCPASSTQEMRTVQIPTSQGVRLAVGNGLTGDLAFLSTTGAMRAEPSDIASEFSVEASIDAARSLRTTLGLSGRPSVCSPGGGVTGFPAC